MPTNYDKHPFLLGVDNVANALGTNVDSGLTTAQVQKLQQEFPPNELDAGGAIPWYSIFLKQLFNAMVLVCEATLLYPYISTLCRAVRA